MFYVLVWPQSLQSLRVVGERVMSLIFSFEFFYRRKIVYLAELPVLRDRFPDLEGVRHSGSQILLYLAFLRGGIPNTRRCSLTRRGSVWVPMM